MEPIVEDHGSVEVTEQTDVKRNRTTSFYVQDIVHNHKDSIDTGARHDE